MRPPPPPPPPGGILRRGGRGGRDRQVRFAPSAAIPPEEEEEDDDEDEEDEERGPVLATPTPHSTRGGPGAAPPGPFDAPGAAAALLGRSFAARSALGGAAAAAMNVPPARRLFRGLVSLAVPRPPRAPRRAGPPAGHAHQVPGPCPAVLSLPVTGGSPWLPPPAPPEPPRARPCPPGAAGAMQRKRLQWGGG